MTEGPAWQGAGKYVALGASRPVLLALVPLVVLVSVAAFLTLHFSARLRADRELLLQSYQTIDTVRSLLSSLQDAETGQRGFIITNRETYLEPYDAALAAIPAGLASLRGLVAGDETQLRRVTALEGMVDAKLAELARTIELGRSGQFAAARAEILSDQGKAAMDVIRRVVHELIDAEDAQVAARLQQTGASQWRTLFAAMAGSVLGLLAILGGAALLMAGNRRLRAAESDLAQQGSLLQATLDHTRDGIAAFDADGRLLAWNRRFFDLLGLPAELARRGTRLDQLWATGTERLAAILARPAADQDDVFLPLTAGGRELEVYRNLMAGGGFVVSCVDVTRRLQAEQILRQSQRMEAIGHLTGGVAHDFNNLLQVIASNLDLLRQDIESDGKAAQRLRNAIAGTERGAKLTAQLLAFARRQPLDPRVVNLGRLVRDVGDLLKRSLGDRIEVEAMVSGGLWNTAVDPSQVENAILNLAINARDAMPDGGKLTIEVSNAVLDDAYAFEHDEVAPGQYVLLAVSDTGVGIAPEIKDRVFEPFFTTKPEGQGTGLGLSQVYGFVKQSGGHIKVYSEQGRGTTVKIYLPRSRRPEERLPMAAPTPVEGGTETVLVVEDDAAVRAAAVETLTELGYRVLKAEGSEAALAILAGGVHVDLLFTDVVMPGPVTTRDLVRQASALTDGIAVLYTSGYTENAIIHEGRLDEGILLLSKPYRRDELARRVRQALDQARRAREVAKPARRTVLLVEDEALIRMGTVEMLRNMGHAVWEAGSGEEALAMIRERPEIDVLITDLGLPGMSGHDLAQAARRLRPRLSIILASGYAAATSFPPDLDGIGWLGKPFMADDLARALARLGPGEAAAQGRAERIG